VLVVMVVIVVVMLGLAGQHEVPVVAPAVQEAVEVALGT
jgi:hypothetical protein